LPLPGLTPQHAAVRSEFSGLYTGLWGVPMSPWLAGHDEPDIPWAVWQASFGLPVELWAGAAAPVRLGEFRHAITRYRLKVTVFQVTLDGRHELPRKWSGRVTGSRLPHERGLFFALTGKWPPLSTLAKKALHCHRDSVV